MMAADCRRASVGRFAAPLAGQPLVSNLVNGLALVRARLGLLRHGIPVGLISRRADIRHQCRGLRLFDSVLPLWVHRRNGWPDCATIADWRPAIASQRASQAINPVLCIRPRAALRYGAYDAQSR